MLSTNELDSAVSAPLKSSVYTSTRALMARLTVAKVAGVSKPSKPVVSWNGKSAPSPAAVWSCEFASSSSVLMCAYTAALLTAGAGPAFTSVPTSTGQPRLPSQLVSRVSTMTRKSSAWIVFTKPIVAAFSPADSWSVPTEATPSSTMLASRMLAYGAAQRPAPKPPALSGPWSSSLTNRGSATSRT